MKMSSKIMPDDSSARRICHKLFGKIENKIFEPSSGGIGTRLNVANTRLINTIVLTIYCKESDRDPDAMPKRKIRPNTRAITMFVAGPAMATNASPHR